MGKKAKTASRSNAPVRPSGKAGARAFAAPALVVALVLLQGGYYAGATCVVAIIGLVAYAVAVALRKVEPTCPWHSAVLGAVGAVYLASAIAHGATLTMLQEAATWFALAGMSLWCAPSSAKERDATLEYLSLAGTGLAVIGVLMYVGLIPVEGAVSAGRLMFTFQYANTAGLFFAVIAVLCLCSPRREHRVAALVPAAALLLTQSVGAIAVFLVAFVPIAMRWMRGGEGVAARAVAIAVSLSALAAVAVACVLLRERLMQAAGTFAERIVQMLDALSLLAGNAALGVGPDQWQFVYPAVQSAQYRAADVHCSYLQVALDGGLPALVLLLALVAGGVAAAVRQRAFAPSLAACMVAVHALFDFDFQFAAIVLAFVVLTARPEGGSSGGAGSGASAPSKRLQTVLCWCVAACSLAGACGGAYLDLQMGQVQGALARGDAQQALSVASALPCLADDEAIRTLVCEGLFQAGDDQAVLAQTDGLDSPRGSVGFCRALAQQRLGMDEAACQTLSDALAASPYDADLLQAARDYIVESGLGEPYIELFNAAASASNGRAREGRAAWLPNQKQVELIGGAS